MVWRFASALHCCAARQQRCTPATALRPGVAARLRRCQVSALRDISLTRVYARSAVSEAAGAQRHKHSVAGATKRGIRRTAPQAMGSGAGAKCRQRTAPQGRRASRRNRAAGSSADGTEQLESAPAEVYSCLITDRATRFFVWGETQTTTSARSQGAGAALHELAPSLGGTPATAVAGWPSLRQP